mmetsp:Transcript_6162/g.12000  ORF Transcript_6162/g.12000 Transcript_6162/m.12000 type:complete len:218 (+) Transcript_6162:76-729(+)
MCGTPLPPTLSPQTRCTLRSSSTSTASAEDPRVPMCSTLPWTARSSVASTATSTRSASCARQPKRRKRRRCLLLWKRSMVWSTSGGTDGSLWPNLTLAQGTRTSTAEKTARPRNRTSTTANGRRRSTCSTTLQQSLQRTRTTPSTASSADQDQIQVPVASAEPAPHLRLGESTFNLKCHLGHGHLPLKMSPTMSSHESKAGTGTQSLCGPLFPGLDR